MLNKGVNVNAPRDRYNGSTLHVALLGGFEKVVKLLLDNGADINA